MQDQQGENYYIKLLYILRANLSHTHMAGGHHLLWSFFICVLISFIYSILFFLSMKCLLYCLCSLETTFFPISSCFACFVLLSISSMTFFISTLFVIFLTPAFSPPLPLFVKSFSYILLDTISFSASVL